MNASQRKALALKLLTNALEPQPDQGSNESALTIAALELVSESLAGDVVTKERLREKYEEIASLATKQPKSPPKPKPMPTLLPGRGRGVDTYNPYAKLNPFELLEDYGAHQLRAVLERATQQSLRDAVAMVQKHNPGTVPNNRTKSADMIDYIVLHVAGPGY